MSKKLLNVLIVAITFSLALNAGNAVVPMKENRTNRFVLGDLEWSPSSDVYSNWDNYSAHAYVLNIPDEFEIDLTDFKVPIKKSNQVISPYGMRFGRMHHGVDIKAMANDTIYAAFDGKVRVSRYNAGGYGNFIVIRHYNGLETVYGHLNRALVRPNEYVYAGQPIGLAGSTGRSMAVHLHFEMRFCGESIDPQLLVSFKEGECIFEKYTYKKKRKRK